MVFRAVGGTATDFRAAYSYLASFGPAVVPAAPTVGQSVPGGVLTIPMTNPHTALAAVLPPPLPAAANLWVPGKALRPGGYRDWEHWLSATFPTYCRHPFAPHHRQIWEWLWELRYQLAPPSSLVAVLARGGAKSTTAELGVVAVGRRRSRKYVLYVSGTQDQADKHVATIASMLGAPALARQDPDLTNRRVDQFGRVRGWRRDRLMTHAGMTVDGIGLDVAMRGIKVDDVRPDLIILDDIDSRDDSLATIEKKISAVTESILPAGSTDVAVLAVQNLIHEDSIFARLADGRADFLLNRRVLGPIPALRDMQAEAQDGGGWKVTGIPTWAGQDVEACNRLVATIGMTAFKRESQHEVESSAGSVFEHVQWQHIPQEQLPDMVHSAVVVDPAVTATDHSDACGIIAGGRDAEGRTYAYEAYEERMSPQTAILRALRLCLKYRANTLVVETDQGGKAWDSVVNEAWRLLTENGEVPKDYRRPTFVEQRAGKLQENKTERGLRMLTDYEKGLIFHVSGTTMGTLERGLRRAFIRKPFDIADAMFWLWFTLRQMAPIDRTRKRETRYVGSFAPARRYERRR